MAASLAFDPVVTTTAAGSFNISSSGFIAGTAYADPASRYYLSGGVLAATETLPMWGGVGVSELVPSPGSLTLPERSMGTLVSRATNYTNGYTAGALTGFSVFAQANGMINTPQSPVPLASPGMSVNFYRFGSNAPIAVPCSAALASLENSIIGSRVSWDFVNQLLVPYTPGYAADTITGAVWASTSGGQITFTVASDISADLSAGDIITVTGVVNTGGSSTSAFNGEWVVVSATSTTIVVTAPASASIGTYASGGTVAAANGGAIPVRILDMDIGNSMVPVYNSTTGFCSWNRSGNCAVVLI